MIPLAITFYGIVMAVALGIALWTGDSLLYANSHAQQQGLRPLRDVTAGLGVAAFTIAASHLLTERTGWGRRLAGALAQAMGQRSLAECVLLAIVSGVAEEALFRGAIQPHVGLLGASLLFGLAHFAPRRDLLPWTGFALLMGLAFGGLFEWTGNLVAPVMAHAGVNAVNLRLLSLRYA
jgi:hypothetical protein